MKPGYKTTEFWATAAAQLAGLAMTLGLISPIEGDAATVAATKLGGLASMTLGSLGYLVSRTKLKGTELAPEAPPKPKKRQPASAAT